MSPHKPKVSVAFEFVVEMLDRLNPKVRPMFGCHAVYIGEKIVLVLRKKETNKTDNGIFIATTREHHPSLKETFPSLRQITMFSPNSEWINLPEDAPDFEESAFALCDQIIKQDPRIGKIVRKKKKKRATR